MPERDWARERAIIQMLEAGVQQSVIASRLCVNRKTIYNVKRRMMGGDGLEASVVRNTDLSVSRIMAKIALLENQVGQLQKKVDFLIANSDDLTELDKSCVACGCIHFLPGSGKCKFCGTPSKRSA
jgi:hypothetical protein